MLEDAMPTTDDASASSAASAGAGPSDALDPPGSIHDSEPPSRLPSFEITTSAPAAASSCRVLTRR